MEKDDDEAVEVEDFITIKKDANYKNIILNLKKDIFHL